MAATKKSLLEKLEERTDAALTQVFESNFTEAGIKSMITAQINKLLNTSLLSILGLTNKWSELEFIPDGRDSPHLLKELINDRVGVIRTATEKAFKKEIEALKPTAALKKLIKDQFIEEYRREFNWDLKEQVTKLLRTEAESIASEQIAKYRKSVGLPTDEDKKTR